MAVLVETSIGDLVIDLYTKECPNACQNFLKLCKQKFYNGALFMNLQRNYLTQIQTINSPRTIFGTEYFDDESLSSRKHDRVGIVATSNHGPNQNNSDFYITLSAENTQPLNMKHTIFGQVQEGLDVLVRMNEIHVDEQFRPLLNIRIRHTTILDDPFEDPPQLKPVSRSPSPKTFKGFGRLEYEEKEELIDKMDLKNEHELIELAQEHKAKSRAVVLEMLEDIPDADIKPPDNILYVCRLNPVTEEKDLEIIFSKFGPIKKCDIVRDWKTGQSLQYAFIEFETTASCEEAYLKMENALIDDRRVHVDFCQSSAKQWAQLKKAQRRKKLLHDQRNTLKQSRDNNQTMIDQLEVKNDYFNTRNNFNYLIDAPPVKPVDEVTKQALAPILQQKVEKQKTTPIKKRKGSSSPDRRRKKSAKKASSSRSRSRKASKKHRKN